MAIKRQKIDRKANMDFYGENVADIASPGWAFTIDCPYHGKIHFDFNPYRENGRMELAGHMRDAFWSLRYEVVGKTLQARQLLGLRPFWRFLDDLNAAGESITHLDQVGRELIDRYLAWLEIQIVLNGKNKGQKWSIITKKKSFDHIKALLINRQKRAPAAISPTLAFPCNPFPNSNQLTPKREPYLASEQKCILEALNKDLRTIHEGAGGPLTDLQVLAVHLLLLGLATGRNLQSLLDLRRDSLREHPLPDRELLVTIKRRGWTTHATSVRKDSEMPEIQQAIQTIPASIGDHFRFLCNFTTTLVGEAAEDDREFVFLWQLHWRRKGEVIRLNGNTANREAKLFALRHALVDNQGHPLALNMSRLRPTFATELYRRTRDIRRVQQALGHSSPETTACHYIDKPLETERDHSIVLDGMVSRFVRMEVGGKVLLAADGEIPLQDLKDLLSGGYNTGIARCKNPFRESESVCQKFFHCFKCPSMCVFEDDLWRLFSFYYRLLAERPKINAAHWLKTYGPIVRKIDADIASQFPADKVETARIRAQEHPHPAWRGPLI